MNPQVAQLVQHRLVRLRQQCRTVEASIARCQQIDEVVRLAESIRPSPELRALLQRDMSRLRQLASERIETLLASLPAHRYRTVYALLCGRFPLLAMRVRKMMFPGR